MVINYKSKKVQSLCEDIKEIRRFFNKDVTVRKFVTLMTTLKNVDHIKEFDVAPALKQYRHHELSGDKKGLHSLSIDYSYRMTLIVEFIAIDGEQDIIEIQEVSKHYGD